MLTPSGSKITENSASTVLSAQIKWLIDKVTGIVSSDETQEVPLLVAVPKVFDAPVIGNSVHSGGGGILPIPTGISSLIRQQSLFE